MSTSYFGNGNKYYYFYYKHISNFVICVAAPLVSLCLLNSLVWWKLQVWRLSSFEVSCQLLTTDLNQVLSVSLLMTSSTALTNQGLYELTPLPLLTWAVLLSFAETTDEPGCSQVKKLKFGQV